MDIKSNRVTRAIAALPERFTRDDIVQEAGVSDQAVTPPLKELESLGMIEVCRIGQKGAKTWCKTDKYRPPVEQPRAPRGAGVSRSALYVTSQQEQEQRSRDCLARMAVAMRGWRVPESRI